MWLLEASSVSTYIMPRISKRNVDAISSGSKDAYLWDDELKGFGLKVTGYKPTPQASHDSTSARNSFVTGTIGSLAAFFPVLSRPRVELLQAGINHAAFCMSPYTHGFGWYALLRWSCTRKARFELTERLRRCSTQH